MSYCYEACFSRVPLSLPEALARIDKALAVAGLTFTGETTRLHHRRGVPIVKTHEPAQLPTVEAVGAAAARGRWWGMSMLYHSAPMREVLGRSTAIEVDVAAFLNEGGLVVTCSEPKGAFWARVRTEALEHQLGAMMSAVAAALGATVAVYAEEQEDGQLVIPQPEQVSGALQRWSSHNPAPQRLAVLDVQTLSLEQARALAGRFAARVWLTPEGYVVIPMLTDRDRAQG